MASCPLSEDPFLCPICLEVFTDPISTPCGHNYCNTCITQHWDTSEVCRCPLCQTTFDGRPNLSGNVVLSEMAGQFKRKPANPKMYLIITLILNLLLTLTLCQKFAKPGQIAPLKEDHEGLKKAELRKTDGEVQQMIQERRVKIQEFDDSVELSRSFADREIADSMQVLTALTSSMRRSQAQFVGVGEENHKATERQAEGFIEELRREIAELEERSSELKQLLHTDDPLHVLFLNNFLSVDVPPPTRDWTKVRVCDRPSREETVRTVLERTLRREMEKKRCDAELRTVRQYAADETTLDPDTAQRYSILPEDGERANPAGHEKNDGMPDNTERFSHLQIVVGKQSFSSGRFYYEVQVGGKADWDLGVAREAINGHRPITLSPGSYWAIRLRNGSQCYAAAYPDDVLLLPAREELRTVGVFVDYEEGVVSFYDVEASAHLYSFTDCAFTEELYPYFSQYFHRSDGAAGAPLEIGRLLIISLCSFLVYIYRRR